MKSAREILAELGFNPHAAEGSKRALFKHLKRQAEVLNARPEEQKPEPVAPGEQLSFDPEILRRT